MLCPNRMVKPFLVSLVEPVAYLKSELSPSFLARSAMPGRHVSYFEVFPTQALKRQISDELCPIDQIASPQPARLLHQAEAPFETVFAHPARCLFPSPRKHVKSCTHANQRGHAQPSFVHVHPAVLSCLPQSHPKHIRRGTTYHLHHFCIFV